MTPVVAVALLAAAGDEFAAGVAARNDAAAARPHFAAAARTYDDAWGVGERTAAVARNRGRAHALAGDTPRAIAAVHNGLAVAPWDRGLREDLATIRNAVPYPDGLRPDPPDGVMATASPADLLAVSAASAVVFAAGVIAYRTTRPPRAGVVIGVGGLTVAVCVILGIQIERERTAISPLVIVAKTGVVLRTGNGVAFPARLEPPLAAGVECRPLAHRGGWVQVELGGEVVGWVPEADVIVVGRLAGPTAAGRSGIRRASGGAGESTGF